MVPELPFVGWLAGRLKQAGLRHCFGVPGGGISLDLLAAMQAQYIDTVITAREDAAVIMAGVSGVLGNRPGLAFCTKGPGLASAANGLASAALDQMPALLVAESFGKQELGYLSHQVFSQTALTDPLLEAGRGRAMSATQGAVEDWLNQGASGPAVMFPTATDFKQLVPDKAAAANSLDEQALDPERAVSLLKAVRRPVVVVGLEAAQSHTTSELRAFVDQIGAPVLCTYMAKGCIADDDPHYAGIFTGGSIEEACVRQADLIILIGLNPVELIRKPWPYEAPVLDICAQVYDPHYFEPTERIVAPLSKTLRLLGGSLAGSDWRRQEIASLRQEFYDGMATGGASKLSSTAVVKAAVEAYSGQPRLCVDAGAHMFSACAFWPGQAPRDVLISNGLATMGFAVPAAIAAALHEPERGAVAMTGDGGLLMCLGELKTAAETKANINIIVFNDGRLSLIDIKREDRQMPELGLKWTPPDFSAIAEGFGFKTWRVGDGGELGPALSAAAQETGPCLVDIRIDASGYRDQLRALRG